MKSDATTVEAYLAELPDDRRGAICAVRDVVNANLAEGFAEVMLYGMISWVVPLARYPDTYNGQPLAIASLASQKRHMALYLNCAYVDEGLHDRFVARWAQSGLRLDMGRSCVRFRDLEDVALDAVGDAIAQTSSNAISPPTNAAAAEASTSWPRRVGPACTASVRRSRR